LKPISKGAYGCVYLARKKKSGDIYAIKVLLKSGINGTQLEHVRAERSTLRHPAALLSFFAFCRSSC
jgi:serine/threonine-protein kinase RIM15